MNTNFRNILPQVLAVSVKNIVMIGEKFRMKKFKTINFFSEKIYNRLRHEPRLSDDPHTVTSKNIR
jgi:hypothetical protein